MRQFKVNKNFQPPLSEAGDELYPNGIFEFNITKLLTFIGESQNKFYVEELDVKTLKKSSFPKNLDESTIKTANLLIPIVLAEISPGCFNVIDGHHRLEKAYCDGREKILGYKIPAEQHIMFLTSTYAYKEYVQYWNTKLENC